MRRENIFAKLIPFHGTIRKARYRRAAKKRVATMRISDKAPPPNSPPADLADRFTMNGRVPLRYAYFDDSRPRAPLVIRAKKYARAFSKFRDRTFLYYGDAMPYFYEAADKYPLEGRTVLVYGLAGCNCEAFAAWKGAKKVIVVDYNPPVCEHPAIEVITHDELNRRNLKADVAISFSSFEHDGLGRYGDPVSPDADLLAMRNAKRRLVEGGLLYLGVPMGRDAVVWNAHRVYGRLRLPLLLGGWECLDVYWRDGDGDKPASLDAEHDQADFHPLAILRGAPSDETDVAACAARLAECSGGRGGRAGSFANHAILAEILEARLARAKRK